MSEFGGLWKHENNQHALVPPKTECGCPSGGGIKNSHIHYLLWRNAERKKKNINCLSGSHRLFFVLFSTALIAMVFPEQLTAAFATYHTSKATAFTLTFALARFLCLYQRLYVSLTLSVLGLFGYAAVEVMVHRAKKTQATLSDEIAKAAHSSDDQSDVEHYQKIKSP